MAAVAMYAATAATYYRASDERLAFRFLAALLPGHDLLPRRFRVGPRILVR